LIRCYVLALVAAVGYSLAAGAAEPKDELVGKWVSNTADKIPLVFAKDGTCKCGSFKEKGEWVFAEGKYTITDKGEITVDAKLKGAAVKEKYTLKDSVLTGSHGPDPVVKWEKVKE
jgi:uncharacterized protein (TIGR03066 family)